MNRQVIAIAIAAVTSLSGASAMAAAEPYVSVAVGGSHADIDCSGTDSCTDNSYAAKVIAGYDFGNQFAVEAMYVSLGAPKASVDGIDVKLRNSFWGIGGAWRPVFNADWSGVARVGVAFSTSKVEASMGGISGSQSYDSTTAYAGIGLAYTLTKKLKIEADLDTTQIKVGTGSDAGQNTAIDYTLGLTYAF